MPAVTAKIPMTDAIAALTSFFIGFLLPGCCIMKQTQVRFAALLIVQAYTSHVYELLELCL